MTQIVVGPPFVNAPPQLQQHREKFPVYDNLCFPLCGPWSFGSAGACGGANCCAVLNGFVLIIFGMISLSLGIALASYYTGFDGYAYAPIWAGVLCLLAGLIGVATCCASQSRATLRCMLYTFFGVCIIAIVTSFAQLVLEGIRASDLEVGDAAAAGDRERYDEIKALHISTAIFAGLTFLASVIGGVLSCVCSYHMDVPGDNVLNPQQFQVQQAGLQFNDPLSLNQGGLVIGGGMPILNGGLYGGGLMNGGGLFNGGGLLNRGGLVNGFGGQTIII